MAGLAAGAYLFGRAADRLARPLRTYAYLEAGIAVYALLLPVILRASGPLYVGLARAVAGHPPAMTAVRMAYGFGLLLLPTVLMGATLPLLLRFVSRSQRRFGWDLGTLYAVNLAGAMVGSAAAGFVLIRVLGVHGACVAAATGNLTVALVAVLLSHSLAPSVGRSQAASEEAPTAGISASTGLRATLWAVVFVSGLASIGYEVLWTRILVFPFYSTVHSFTIILATFVGSLALGSAVFAALGARRHTPRLLAAALIGAGLSALLLAPLSASIPEIIGGLSTRLGYTGGVYLGARAASAALLILLPATLMGIVFPLGSRLLVTDLRRLGTRIGAAYFVNTIGCVLGSLGTGFLLIPLLSLKGSLVFLSGLQVLVGSAVIYWCGWPSRRGLLVRAGSALAFAGALVVALGLLRGPNPFDTRLRAGRSQGTVLEAHRDGAASSVSVVTNRDGSRTLRIDGFQTALDNVYASYKG
jgi:spermidine synthase